ncbi:aminotransferase class V-fold PLP-dependent enzyme [candidate division CSSED10-310 bacterium]|uniref:Aminotransferase class V-fold PLP-dependent enzyme n=1 Tax=candidate division CSSED10-310 bacterium TaxID=2855610 RepID=A0ABV6YU20_UNCC1
MVSEPVKQAVQEWVEQGRCAEFQYEHIINQALGNAARLVQGRPEEIFFSKNTTHGIELFILGYPWQAGDAVVLADCEFPANRLPWLGLTNLGVEVRVIKTTNHGVSLAEIEQQCDSKTKVVTVSWVQYLSGQRIDLQKLGDFCHSEGIMLVVDAIQGLGAVPFDAPAWQIDWVSADGHKWLCGPEGTGIVWVSQKALHKVRPACKGWAGVIEPFEFDRYDQDFAPTAARYNDGSPNLMGIMALDAALQMLLEAGVGRIFNRILELSAYTMAKVRERDGFLLTPPDSQKRAGIVTFKIGDQDSQAVWAFLKEHKVMCSVRSGWLRISTHGYNTSDDIDHAFEVIDALK